MQNLSSAFHLFPRGSGEQLRCKRSGIMRWSHPPTTGTIVIFFGKNFAMCRYQRALLWVDIIVLLFSASSLGCNGLLLRVGWDGFHTPLWHSWSGGSLSHRGRCSSEWMQTVGVSSVSSKKTKKQKDLLVHLLGQGGGDGGPGVLAMFIFRCRKSYLAGEMCCASSDVGRWWL